MSLTSSPETPNFLTHILSPFENLLSSLKKETKETKEKLDAAEVAKVMYEDFKNKVFTKKTQDVNGAEKQYYSAQLLGTLDFLGDTLIQSVFKKKYKGGMFDSITSQVQYALIMKSLEISGISEQERSDFQTEFDAYLNHLPNLKTRVDLEQLKAGNVEVSADYKVSVDQQLEVQAETQIQLDRQRYITQQQQINPSFSETALLTAGKIGTLPKSFPVASSPFERSNRGTTLCSKTAWANGQTFGINLPRLASARESLAAHPTSPAFQLTVQDTQLLKSPDFSKLAPQSNFVDLSVVSNTSAGRMYGHRAVAFLNQKDHQRYVLDPYTGNNF